MTEGHNVYIRNVDPDTYAKLRQGAAARGMTIGTYLAKLVRLHDQTRYLVENGERQGYDLADLEDIMTDLGLQTVTR